MKILDTSALINAYPFRHAYTVMEVVQELTDPEMKRAAHNLIASRKLIIIDVSDASVKAVRDAAKQTGDSLSGTDCKVLGLALEKEAVVVTDDYGIQNVAKKLGVKFLPAGQKGIRHHYLWRHYCTACRRYRSHYMCRVCGTRTKRKVVSRRG